MLFSKTFIDMIKDEFLIIMNFYFKFSCLIKWNNIAIYVLNQLKLNVKVDICKVLHIMNLIIVYELNIL